MTTNFKFGHSPLRLWMSAGIITAMMSLAGCGGTDNAGEQPAVTTDSAKFNETLAERAGPGIPSSNSPEALLKVAVLGNGLYLALSSDGHSIYKSSDGSQWQIAFTHDRRVFRELSFENGTFAARTRKVRFTSSDPLAAIWTREKKVHGASHPEVIPNSYIVMYDDDANIQDVKEYTDELAKSMNASGRKMRITHVYQHAGPGFAADMSDEAAQRLRENSAIAYVQHDHQIHLIEEPATSVGAFASGSQTTTPNTSNLDRIDQANLPLDGKFNYPATGKGVHAFVMDTGIRPGSPEFSGKPFGASRIRGDGCLYNRDVDHGTHVAGTIGAKTYGVAKDVTLHSLNMAGCNGGLSSQVSDVDWVIGETIKNNWRSVVNMSWGSGPKAPGATIGGAFYDAITNATRAGVVMVASAGNWGGLPNDPKNRPTDGEACNVELRQHPELIVVGATEGGVKQAGYSSYGRCVTLLAPGEAFSVGYKPPINNVEQPTGIFFKNGTSMAAPLVTGAAAIYLELYPRATAAQVRQALIDTSTKNVLQGDLKGSPNRLLNINFQSSNNPPETGGGAPTGYTKCADEGGTCSLPGTRDVIYGGNGRFNLKASLTGSVACNNGTFGDPMPGAKKACYYKGTQTPPPPPPPPSGDPAGYTKCADEGGTCSLPGTRDVIYGGNGRFNLKANLTGSIACNNGTFGDPMPGAKKACYYKQTQTPTPPPSGGPAGYAKCANEGGTCAVPSASQVAYGANGTFIYASTTGAGAFPCTNTVFLKDPVPAVQKACYFKPK